MMLRKMTAELCSCFKHISNTMLGGVVKTNHLSVTTLGIYFAVFTFFLASYATPIKGVSTPKNKADVSKSLYSISVGIPVESNENLLTDNIEVPRVQELRRKRRRKNRRSKKNKKCKDSYCFNGGHCYWIKELEQTNCRCKGGFNGDRCQFLDVGFTGKQKELDTTIAIAIVVSAFVLLGILTAVCICWRRFKNVRDHLEISNLETEEKHGMMIEHEINRNNLKKSDPKDDRVI